VRSAYRCDWPAYYLRWVGPDPYLTRGRIRSDSTPYHQIHSIMPSRHPIRKSRICRSRCGGLVSVKVTTLVGTPTCAERSVGRGRTRNTATDRAAYSLSTCILYARPGRPGAGVLLPSCRCQTFKHQNLSKTNRMIYAIVPAGEHDQCVEWRLDSCTLTWPHLARILLFVPFLFFYRLLCVLVYYLLGCMWPCVMAGVCRWLIFLT